MLQVQQRVIGLRVGLRIRAHFDPERITMLGADEADQLGGIPQVAGVAHARGQVTAQGDDAAAADRAVQLEQFADLLAAATDAGQVRCRLEAMVLLEVTHRLGGVAERRAAGTERTRHVLRREHLQLGRGPVQLGTLLVGLGRIELEADGGHGRGASAGVV